MNSIDRPALFDQRPGRDTPLTGMSDNRGAVRRTLAPGWGIVAISVALSWIVLGFAFHRDVEGAVQVWIESTAYNHCFLVLPLIGFLLWERRVVFSTAPLPSFSPLIGIPLLSGLWLFCAILDINEGRQLLLIAIFEIMLLAFLGMRTFKLLLAPALFLFFLVPSGAFLVPTLQKITADIAVNGLQLLHIPVYSDGMIIDIPEGSFEVAEACAGLRFLIASIVFGCFFAVTMYRSYWRRLLFIVLSATVPIGANGVRALGIITVAHLEGSATAVEADHILYGWIFFTLVILMLIAIGITFTDKAGITPAISTNEAGRMPPISAYNGQIHSAWRTAAVLVLAVTLALCGPVYAARVDSQPSVTLATDPIMSIRPPWQVALDPGLIWRPLIHSADSALLQTFEEPGAPPVVSFVALYRLRSIGNSLTNSENRIADDKQWQLAKIGSVAVAIDGRQSIVNTAQIVNGPDRRLVWSFYVVDGKITSGQLEAKWLQAQAVLFRHSAAAAFVAASASDDQQSGHAADQLKRFFEARQRVIRYLLALSEGKGAH